MSSTYTQQNIQQIIIEAIQEAAPEIEQEDINMDEDIREECDLDSMDFINYLIALKKSTGVSIAEGDYSQVNTFNKMLNYLSAQLSKNPQA
ncbi:MULTISPECIES: acyl carrier protein [unclassified Colwellia]|jgi:acyl carrier protein|uniref:acyl carrier protein n=1 Tax=unclassified Colwellia TaxID=196834 RepID=UPI0015F5E567|nr:MULTISPECIES: phosphopantetheine-binding protein [unclassified Colwellia]MBA6234026.1 acyl carrier protein [Colwellia sp. MB02u-7]MBA6238052.1 acyl carrier protein [Colwellia sp. MB02u-11]MBA6257621.1 acyl carrier protein [Colwellia sp. MB3u-28]MBA6259378.1 acyl carrier protein [Colwellia sp. MB3u-41]MBA6300700.1 acyl carrier protein [Colwellia sp. MB3u-22]